MPTIESDSYLRTPKYTVRSPLSRAIERNLEQRNLLLSDPLLDLKDVKQVFGVCESTLRRWIRMGVLPVIRFSPRGHLKCRQSVVQKLLAEGMEVGNAKS